MVAGTDPGNSTSSTGGMPASTAMWSTKWLSQCRTSSQRDRPDRCSLAVFQRSFRIEGVSAINRATNFSGRVDVEVQAVMRFCSVTNECSPVSSFQYTRVGEAF